MDIFDNQEYLISVRLMTYNHEQYIAKAMESVLMQKTKFMVELVVGDDFSTDKTLEIIKSFSSTEHIKVKVLNRAPGDNYWRIRQELGRMYNFINILENCSGKYIALLDGDDYWTDPYKLQMQVDFLESNPEYSLCFHRADRLLDGEMLLDRKQRNSEETLLSLARNLDVPTLSVVFRRISFVELNRYIDKFTGSYFLFMLLANEGKFKFIDETMAVYRVHQGGIWSGKSLYEKANMKLENKALMINYFHNNIKVQRILVKSYNKICLHQFFVFLFRGNFRNAIKFLKRSFYHGFYGHHFYLIFIVAFKGASKRIQEILTI